MMPVPSWIWQVGDKPGKSESSAVAPPLNKAAYDVTARKLQSDANHWQVLKNQYLCLQFSDNTV